MDVRRAVPSDAPVMQYVAERAYTPYLERMDGHLPGPLQTDYAAAVADAEAWVASEDGSVVGFLVLVEEDDAMLLDNVAVLPSHHGRGIGRTLLLLAEERAIASGHVRIRLFTHVTMVENQQLYERHGYVETHRGGGTGLERVFYEKRLGADESPGDSWSSPLVDRASRCAHAGGWSRDGRCPMKSLWCLVGRHSWADRKNEDGERYRECRRCTAVEGDPLPPDFGSTAIGPPGG